MPKPAAEPPALCVYCGAIPPRDAPAGAACARCRRAARPDEIRWERTRPRAGTSRLRGALFSMVVLAAALAMLARIASIIGDAPAAAAVVLAVVALGLVFIALGAAAQLVDDLFAAQWRFVTRDWRVRGEVTTRFGRVRRASARVARFTPLPLAPATAALSSRAARAAGPRALLDALPALWLERHWWSGPGAWERADETAVVVLAAVLGAAARGELELLREEDAGWTIARAGRAAEPVSRARARERAALRPADGAPGGAPWLEREVAAAVAQQTTALTSGSGDAPGAGPYRAAAAEAGATSLAVALRAVTSPAAAASQVRWEWLAREMDAAEAGLAAPESPADAGALGAVIAAFCTDHPELAALMLAEIHDALEMVG